ncbi:unnamed protein product [Cyclocybe aegerita]|uniref:Uncharacterized protein n=1 Tax=Cyclocybe aegerita TaxID=1973307 RepID=A0A8S0VVU3_CYCAE|nr:unnamed protein product [Cyclocybe aegerita]
MAKFRVPPLYKSKHRKGKVMDLVVFGFPISKNYLLQFADAHNILLNDQDTFQRSLAAYIHMGLEVEKHFDARLVDVWDRDDGSGDNAHFSVAIASNRTRRHLSRMRTYRYLEALAKFLGLDPEGAGWMYPERDNIVELIREGSTVV